MCSENVHNLPIACHDPSSSIGSPLFDTLTHLFKLIGHFFGKSMPWHDTAERTHQTSECHPLQHRSELVRCLLWCWRVRMRPDRNLTHQHLENQMCSRKLTGLPLRKKKWLSSVLLISLSHNQSTPNLLNSKSHFSLNLPRHACGCMARTWSSL